MTDQATVDGFTAEELEDARMIAAWAGELYAIRQEADLDALSGTRGPWTILVTRSGAKVIHREHGMRHLDIELEEAPADVAASQGTHEEG